MFACQRDSRKTEALGPLLRYPIRRPESLLPLDIFILLARRKCTTVLCTRIMSGVYPSLEPTVREIA